MSEKKIENILALDGLKRYKYAIKVIADYEEAWGLYNDGWALSGTSDGLESFPIWPAKEFAELCTKREWEGFEAEVIPLDALINELLPQLAKDEVKICVFQTPSDKGVVPEIEQLKSDIEEELENY